MLGRTIFFFTQKTAYEMRISDWSSDVCSSDLTTTVPTAAINLGDTSIGANGDAAGRIEFLGDGAITMASLTAEALGSAAPTNNDTDAAASGIFFGVYGGTVPTAGNATLTTAGSIGVHGQGGGLVANGGDMSLTAGDQIDTPHYLPTCTPHKTTAGGPITGASVTAEALGSAAPTNKDTDAAASGIFFGVYGGTVQTAGNATLTTDGSIGVHGQGGGIVAIGGDLSLQAGDQIDIRHDFRAGTAPTIQAGGNLIATAGTGISSAAGSLLAANGTLSLTDRKSTRL